MGKKKIDWTRQIGHLRVKVSDGPNGKFRPVENDKAVKDWQRAPVKPKKENK